MPNGTDSAGATSCARTSRPSGPRAVNPRMSSGPWSSGSAWSRSWTVEPFSRPTRWPSVPPSGDASTAMTGSSRRPASVAPSAAAVVVLPVPPFRLITAMRWQPARGERRTSAPDRCSRASGPRLVSRRRSRRAQDGSSSSRSAERAGRAAGPTPSDPVSAECTGGAQNPGSGCCACAGSGTGLTGARAAAAASAARLRHSVSRSRVSSTAGSFTPKTRPMSSRSSA